MKLRPDNFSINNKQALSAAQKYTDRLRAEIGKLPEVEFKEWKPSPETLRVWARVKDPYESIGSDGRDLEKGLRNG